MRTVLSLVLLCVPLPLSLSVFLDKNRDAPAASQVEVKILFREPVRFGEAVMGCASSSALPTEPASLKGNGVSHEV